MKNYEIVVFALLIKTGTIFVEYKFFCSNPSRFSSFNKIFNIFLVNHTSSNKIASCWKSLQIIHEVQKELLN